MKLKNLYQVYSEAEIRGWESYYRIPIYPSKLFNGVVREESERCMDFIFRHFESGRKEAVVRTEFYEQYEKQGKHTHTVNLFLLGLLFEDLFATELKKDVSRLIPNTEEWFVDKEFKYSWFLSCLYHDIASCVEHIEKGNRVRTLNGYLKKNDMKDSPYKQRPMKNGVKLLRFPESLIRNYFRYRCANKSFDHGIVGGYYLFEYTKKNFQDKTSGKELPYIDQDGISWRREHLDHFAYIADSIICHNLWTVEKTDEKDAEIYSKYGLYELVLSEEKQKLSLEKYPLQFMLCLLDSIEPVKRFSGMSAKEVLENISMVQKEKTIQITWSDELKKQDGFWDWMKNISSLEKWMNVQVSSCEAGYDGCGLSIRINAHKEKARLNDEYRWYEQTRHNRYEE